MSQKCLSVMVLKATSYDWSAIWWCSPECAQQTKLHHYFALSNFPLASYWTSFPEGFYLSSCPRNEKFKDLTSAFQPRIETERSAQFSTITAGPRHRLTVMEGLRGEGRQRRREREGVRWCVSCCMWSSCTNHGPQLKQHIGASQAIER